MPAARPAATTTVDIGTPRASTGATSPRFQTPLGSQTSVEELEGRLDRAGIISMTSGPVASTVIPANTVVIPANLLECPVCLQRFEQARVLGRCGHTLCQQCVRRLHNASDMAVRCPICRRDVADGDDQPNYVIQAILGETAPQAVDSNSGIAASIQQTASSRAEERSRQRRDQTELLTTMFRGGHFPWWLTEEPITALIARTALADGRHGPILDIGAYGSLSGDKWVREQARRAVQAGHKPVQRKLDKSMSVSGVGKGAQSVEWEVTLPIAVTDDRGDTRLDDFKTPVIPDSDVPGLLGLQSVQRLRGVIDTFENPPKLYCCGPGGYEIKLSPGSRTYPLYPAPSGHLILPTSEFDKVSKDSANQPRERALDPHNDEPMHLQATSSISRAGGPPLDESEASVHLD